MSKSRENTVVKYLPPLTKEQYAEAFARASEGVKKMVKWVDTRKEKVEMPEDKSAIENYNQFIGDIPSSIVGIIENEFEETFQCIEYIEEQIKYLKRKSKKDIEKIEKVKHKKHYIDMIKLLKTELNKVNAKMNNFYKEKGWTKEEE